MKQVHLKLLLSLILASLATAQYGLGDASGRLAGGSGYNSYTAPKIGYSAPPAYNAPSAPPAYSAPSAPPAYSAPLAPPAFSAPSAPPAFSAPLAPPAYSAPLAPPAYNALSAPVVSYAPKSIAGSGYATTAYSKPSSYSAPPYSKPSYSAPASSSYGTSGGSYGGSYGGYQPTGPPFGIQSTGDYNYNYQEEPLDLSKCGPPPTVNPCTAYGPQYFPLPGNPFCYIQCAFERLFVKPCPANLVWNPRINVCDWPTVGYGAGDASYGSGPSYSSGSSYGGSSYAAPAPKDASYSYGRKRRSTERKKRNLHHGSADASLRMKRQFGVPPLVPVPPIPIGAPILPFGIPGPIPFGGPLGFPGFPGPLGIPTPFFVPPRNQRKPQYPKHHKHKDYNYGKKYDKGYGKMNHGKKYYSHDNNNYYKKDYGKGNYYSDNYRKKDSYKKKYDNDDHYGKDKHNKNNYASDYYKNDRKDKKKDYNAYDYDDDYYNHHSKNSDYLRNGNFLGHKHKSHSKGNGKYNGKYDDKRGGKHDGKYNDKNRDKDYDKNDRNDDYDSGSYRKKRDYGSETNVEIKSVPISFVSVPNSFEVSSLCAGKTKGENVPHPTDPTKYIACPASDKPEIMDCPEGLIYDAILDRCESIKKTEAICDSKPCLNNGQCHETSPSTFQCTCLSGWSGERCESPISACASNPCGPGNTCHSLRAKDYPQDFVCLCNDRKTYGLSCDRVDNVPNPCLTADSTLEQYHPFAFTTNAFIQCNGDLLYVQPCAAGLEWNQPSKVCDLPTPPVVPVADELASYQITSGTEIKPTNVLPTIGFASEKIVSSNSYGQVEEKLLVKVNEESSSSYGSNFNRVMKVKEVPTYGTYFNPRPSFPEMRSLQPKTFVPVDSYGSGQVQPQQRLSSTEFLPTSYSRSVTPTITLPKSTFVPQGNGYQTEKFLPPSNQYGQGVAERSHTRLAFSAPYDTSVDTYGNVQPERIVTPHLPKRHPTRVLQPEFSRNSYSSGSY